MNRREALQLLATLPALTVANLNADDVIVIECDMALTDAMRAGIDKSLRRVWPNQEIVIFDQGIHMRITRDAVKA